MATQAELDAHVNDTIDAHDASAITNVPAGGIAATDVQAAIDELESEKAAVASAVMDGDAAGGVLSGTYPNPGFAADMATQAELDAHTGDPTAAHAASAISADSTTLSGTGTDVQAVLEEIDNLLDDHSGRHENGGADEISIAGLDGTPTELTNHLNDATDAHDASAISFAATGGLAADDVQEALAELDTEKVSTTTFNDHSARHENGGADEISVAGLSGELADAQPVTVRKNTGADVGTRSRLNFIEGSNVTLTVADDAGGDEVDITIASTGGSGSGEAMERDIAQTAHGLAVGDVVRLSGTNYVKAQANSVANAEVAGIVSAVADANNFTLHYGGRITGLSGLSAATVYFLDDDTAGLLTSTEPPDVGDVSKPVLIADSTTTGYFFNFRGIVVAEAGGMLKVFDSTLGADAASIDTGAAAVPAGYDVMEVFFLGRTTEAVDISGVQITLNADTGANYDRQTLRGTNVTASATNAVAQANWGLGVPGANQHAGAAAVIRFSIPSYAQTTFHKTAECSLAIPDDTAGNNRVEIESLRWRSTAAITRMAVAASSGSLLAGSRLLIYVR